ncbi:hypothetical protein C4D60_Mb06t37090 [Musa balbisiana]|uniref:Uncharacterized protein n=1 Tax=Musa balbisiana TaxID=52838 RepID=A0A4S8ITD9_MUSBA|nr:hypothetical protein C4D60_Mb06t37090 [Musa balbisiana]
MFCARSMRTASSLSSFATHDAIFTAYPDGYRRVESNIDGFARLDPMVPRRRMLLGFVLALFTGIGIYLRIWSIDGDDFSAGDDRDALRSESLFSSSSSTCLSVLTSFGIEDPRNPNLIGDIIIVLATRIVVCQNNGNIRMLKIEELVNHGYRLKIHLLQAEYSKESCFEHYLQVQKREFERANMEAMDESAEWRMRYDVEVDRSRQIQDELLKVKASLAGASRRFSMLQKENMKLQKQFETLKQIKTKGWECKCN